MEYAILFRVPISVSILVVESGASSLIRSTILHMKPTVLLLDYYKKEKLTGDVKIAHDIGKEMKADVAFIGLDWGYSSSPLSELIMGKTFPSECDVLKSKLEKRHLRIANNIRSWYSIYPLDLMFVPSNPYTGKTVYKMLPDLNPTLVHIHN